VRYYGIWNFPSTTGLNSTAQKSNGEVAQVRIDLSKYNTGSEIAKKGGKSIIFVGAGGMHEDSLDRFVPPPGPPVRLGPGKMPFIVISTALTVLLVFVIRSTLLPWLTAGYTQLWDFWIYLHIFGLTTAYVSTMVCFYITWNTQPAVVPENWIPDRDAIDPLSSDNKVRYCEKCEAWQPPRSSHCKHCKRCVLLRDQHCPWFNGCIGFGNMKPYLLFFLFLIGYLSTSIFITGSWIFLSFVGYEFESCHYGTSWNCWIIGLMTALPMIPLGLAAFFFFWHMQLIFTNATSQEFLQYYEMRKRNQEKQRAGAPSEELERWPYDLDEVDKNAKQFIGPNNWLSPVAREQVNDGTKFPLNEQWLRRHRVQRSEHEDEELI